MERGGIRFPVGQKRKAAEAGHGTSWKENQDEAYQHQQRIGDGAPGAKVGQRRSVVQKMTLYKQLTRELYESHPGGGCGCSEGRHICVACCVRSSSCKCSSRSASSRPM